MDGSSREAALKIVAKTTLTTAAVVTAACIAAGGVLVGSIESAAQRERSARSLQIAHALARSFATPLAEGDIGLVQQLVDQTTALPERMPEVTALAVTDLSHRVVAHTDPTFVGTSWRTEPVEMESERYIDGPLPRLQVRVPVGTENRVGALEVLLDPRFMAQETDTAGRAVIVVLLLTVLVLSGSLSYLLNRSVARPIRRLSRAVARFDGRAASIGLHPHGPEEVQSLVLAFDEMAGRLHRHTGELEKAVEERTRELQVAYDQLTEANARLRELAVTDSLTGLSNRRAFSERLGLEIERSSRLSRPLSLILFDIDRFKQLNDSHGHVEGDAALVAVAKLLRTDRRASDLVVRYGGEEFALLLPETTNDDALLVAEKLRRAIDEKKILGGVTVSGGVATFPEHGRTGHDLIAAADHALYEAKNSGRNQVFSCVDSGWESRNRGMGA